PCARGHRRDVGPDAGLGHRERRDQLTGGDPAQPALALLAGAVGEEVRQADVVVQRDPQPEAGNARALALLADDQVEAEVARARAAVALGYCHPEEAATACPGEDLARHDPRALPLTVAALIAEHLALQERAKASAEVLMYIFEQ